MANPISDGKYSLAPVNTMLENETRKCDMKLKPGPASVVNTAMSGKGASIDRVIHVRAPGQATPWLVRATSSPVEIISFDVPRQLAGDWTVEITNLRPAAKARSKTALVEPSEIEVGVAFESGEPRELRFPIEIANRLARDVIAAFDPQLVLDTKRAHVAYTVDETRKEQKLATPEQLTFKKGPWKVELSDIRSIKVEASIEEANARYPGGYIRARITFEEEGTEVKISLAPDAEISGLVLTATVGLAVRDGHLTYEDADVTFPIKINFNFVPDVLVDALIGYSKRIRTMIEAKLLEYSETGRETVQKQIDKVVAKYLPDARVIGVTVTGGALVVTYTEG